MNLLIVPVIGTVLVVLWPVCGRNIFFYYMPMDTKRNRRIALLSGMFFGIICTHFPNILDQS